MHVTRRQLLLGGTALAGALSGGWSWGDAPRIQGAIVGANAKLGHRLRDGSFPEPTATRNADIVIVGGGIAGLSAAWRLRQQGMTDFMLFELENEVGGNASSGRNTVSAYPWGAHYVPLLTAQSEYAAALFEELGIITGRDAAGLPVYNDYYLCADPRERLFMYGRWQEDLLPGIGVTDEDRRQYAAFFAAMDAFRAARGNDGRKAFAIPVDLSSADPAFRDFDRLTILDYMAAQGWNAKPLLWYVDYCCRDDYGTHAAEVSAWAGIHYFAARDGKGAGDDTQSVLTWPEGNGWIVGQLKQRLAAHLRCAQLAWRVRTEAEGITVDVYDPAADRTERISAKAAVLAVPHFVADRLLDRAPDTAHSYAPWMVANVTLRRMPGGQGAPLCWDNVVYDSPSLGYVVATHQDLEQVPLQTVLTYYWPLCDLPPADARRQALGRGYEEWQAMVLGELLRIHPELDGFVERLDVWLWGHGMIRPTPGYIWGEARAASLVFQPPLFQAHSDMSGISIFEEANYRGVQAADAALRHLAA